MSKKSRPHKTPEPAVPQPPAWRTWATVALLLHLLCLGIAFLSNAGPESPSRQALRNVPLATDYLQALSMDRAYDFPLAGALPQDGYHRLVLVDSANPQSEADVQAVPAAGEQLSQQLPSNSLSLGVRRRRYEHLAFWIAHFGELFRENLDLQTQLPHAVARRWLSELGTPTGDHQLICQLVPPNRWPKSAASNAAAASTSTVPTEASPPESPATSEIEPPLTLRLLWDLQAQDLLVSPVEESSQLATVVKDKPPATEVEEVAPGDQSSGAESQAVEVTTGESQVDESSTGGGSK